MKIVSVITDYRLPVVSYIHIQVCYYNLQSYGLEILCANAVKSGKAAAAVDENNLTVSDDDRKWNNFLLSLRKFNYFQVLLTTVL